MVWTQQYDSSSYSVLFWVRVVLNRINTVVGDWRIRKEAGATLGEPVYLHVRLIIICLFCIWQYDSSSYSVLVWVRVVLKGINTVVGDWRIRKEAGITLAGGILNFGM